MSGTPTYRVWRAMLTRCTNQYCASYSDYGGRGIAVCERWHHFSAFLADMGEKPPKLSLDRIDNEKGYAPENCRWATASEQVRNRRKPVRGRVRTVVKSGRGRGRPPIGDKAATARVEVRCTPQEKREYRRKARPLGVSTWLKKLADEAK